MPSAGNGASQRRLAPERAVCSHYEQAERWVVRAANRRDRQTHLDREVPHRARTTRRTTGRARVCVVQAVLRTTEAARAFSPSRAQSLRIHLAHLRSARASAPHAAARERSRWSQTESWSVDALRASTRRPVDAR